VGVIPASLRAPYPDLQENINACGMLHELAGATGKKIILCCCVRRALGDGGAGCAGCRVTTACHIHGGLDA
jgi:sulfur dioxygenase